MLFPPAKLSSADPDFNIKPPTPCPALAATLDFPQTDIPPWPVCSRPTTPPPPGEGGHLGPHGGVKEAARFPGLLWAGSKWLEGSGQQGQCPLTQDCQEEGRKHTGDEGFLMNFNGSGRFALLLPRTYWGA